MTHALLLQLIETTLRPLVEITGGALNVSGDPAETIEILDTPPAGYRVVLTLGGGAALAPNHPTASAETVTLVLQQGQGLEANKGAGIHIDAPGGRRTAIYSRLSKLIGWMHAMTFDGYQATGDHKGEIHCRGLEFGSWSWLVLDGLPTRQLAINFSIPIAFDEQSLEPGDA